MDFANPPADPVAACACWFEDARRDSGLLGDHLERWRGWGACPGSPLERRMFPRDALVERLTGIEGEHLLVESECSLPWTLSCANVVDGNGAGTSPRDCKPKSWDWPGGGRNLLNTNSIGFFLFTVIDGESRSQFLSCSLPG